MQPPERADDHRHSRTVAVGRSERRGDGRAGRVAEPGGERHRHGGGLARTVRGPHTDAVPDAQPQPVGGAERHRAARVSPPSVDIDPPSVIGGFSADETVKGPWVFVFELPGVATLRASAAAGPGARDERAGRFDGDVRGVDRRARRAASPTSRRRSSVGEHRARRRPAEQRARALGARDRGDRRQSEPVREHHGARNARAAAAVGAYRRHLRAVQPPLHGCDRNVRVGADRETTRGTSTSSRRRGRRNQRRASASTAKIGDAFPGTFDGRTWQWKPHAGNGSGWFIANDEGTMLVGVGTARRRIGCDAQRSEVLRSANDRNGSRRTSLVLERRRLPRALSDRRREREERSRAALHA